MKGSTPVQFVWFAGLVPLGIACCAFSTGFAATGADPASAGHDAPRSQTAGVPEAKPHVPSMLLVEPDQHPEIELSWVEKDGTSVVLKGERPFGTDGDRTELGHNVSCYAGVGGTRLVKGAGHPKGAVVRVGFYKIDNARPFFEGVSKDTEITLRVKGVRFNQAVDAHADSVLQHLKYSPDDLKSCGLPGDAREQFNMASDKDTLNGRTIPGVNLRLGAFDGAADAKGEATLRVVGDDHDTVELGLRFRYPVLRNLRDPWESDLPGTFLEPYHFHVEFEVLPEGVEPLPVTTPEMLEAEQERIRLEREARTGGE